MLLNYNYTKFIHTMCGCNHNHSTKKPEASGVTDKTLPSASGVLAYHSFTVYTSAGSNSSKIVGNVSNGACAALLPGLQLEGHACGTS